MTKINPCLKGVSITFNSIFAGFGFFLIYGLFQSSAQLSAAGAPNLVLLWMFTIGVIVVSCLGIYAARSEKVFVLKIFAGLMGVGMFIMLIFGIVSVVEKKQAKDKMGTYLKDQEHREELDQLQQEGQCCGVTDASDWGTTIPQSCSCGYGSVSSSCINKPQGTTGPNRIWQKGCIDVLMSALDPFIKIALGIYFGLAVTALLGFLLTLLMIQQVNRHDSVGSAI